MPIVARRGERGLRDLDHPAGGAAPGLGVLDRDPPGAAVGAGAQRHQLTVEPEQRLPDAHRPRHPGHRIDRVPLRDPVERQREVGVLARPAAGGVQLQRLRGGIRRARRGRHCRGPHRTAGGAEAPGRGQPAHADVEEPARLAPHLERQRQQRQQPLRQRHPRPDRGGVEAAEVAVGAPEARLGLDPLDRGGERGAEAGGRIGQPRGPAAAHRRAGEGEKFSRCPRHSAPQP